MTEKETLEVFLNGVPVGMLTKGKKVGAATFSYHDDATAQLSVGLPLEDKTFDATKTRYWFENLLPEGDLLDSLKERFSVLPKDYFELLRETGRECAGAITFGMPSSSLNISTDSYENAVSVVSSLPAIGPDVDSEALRSILSGYQPKIPMMLRDGVWAVPADGSLTTHIAKPEPARYPGMVDAEAWAMTIAGSVTDAAVTDVVTFNGVRTLVSKRFDRFEDNNGSVGSIHQEDLNQALVLPVERKYATVGGNKKTTPTLAKVAGILSARAVDPVAEMRKLTKQLTVNVLLGNLDWHAKNISFLYDEDGRVSLAPLYDVIPTQHFVKDDHHMSLTVNSKFRLDRIFFLDLVEEAVSWGMDKEEAETIIRETVDRIDVSVSAAQKDFPNLPDTVIGALNIRLLRFGAGPYRGEL